MSSHRRREQAGPSVSDYFCHAPPLASRSTSASRTPRHAPRPSPMSISPSAFTATYAATYGGRASRPPLSRAPPLPPRSSSQSSLQTYHDPEPRSAPRSRTSSGVRPSPSRPSLRTPRGSFDVPSTSSHAKHVAFTSEPPRTPLRPSNHRTVSSTSTSTPPALPFAPSFPTFTLPPSVSLKMHPFLAHSTFRRASISYDIHYPPSSPALLDRRARTTVAGATLAEPATAPALPVTARLTLVHASLPWPVIVCPAATSSSAAARGGSITIFDVVAAVHSSLRRAAGKDDWEALGTGSGAQRRVRQAFESRCTHPADREKGLKRLDWLAGKTRLIGIEVDRSARGPTGRLVFSSPKA